MRGSNNFKQSNKPFFSNIRQLREYAEAAEKEVDKEINEEIDEEIDKIGNDDA